MYYTPNMYNESYEDSPLIAPARGGGFTYSSLTFRSYSTFSAFLIFFFPALGALLFGYDIGSTSAVLIQLKSSTYSGVLWSHDVAESSFLQGAITSMVTLGALIGSIICFQVADSLGRRRSLLLASSLYLFGATLEVISGTPSWRAKWGITVLIVGRLFYGFGCGFAMYGAPAYIAEMAPSLIRGLLVSLTEAFIVLGMILGYTVGYCVSQRSGGWRYTYGLSMPFAVIMFFGMQYLPYSPRWLALKGRMQEARQSLQFVQPDLPESEIDAIGEAAEKAGRSTGNTFADDYHQLTSPTVFPALIVGVGLMFFQQVTGQPSILYYADTLFEDIGISSFASILVSLYKLASTLIATFTVDIKGRKFLLYVGCSLMLCSLIGLGIAFSFPFISNTECNSYLTYEICPSACVWNGVICNSRRMTTHKSLIMICLFVYIGGYQVGFGPISWLIISEIFPLEVRGKAVSVAVITNFFWNTLMTFFFPVEIQQIGIAATFFIYFIILCVGMYFIHTRIPETKGLTLEEISDFFVRSNQVKILNVNPTVRNDPDAIDKSEDNYKLSPVI